MQHQITGNFWHEFYRVLHSEAERLREMMENACDDSDQAKPQPAQDNIKEDNIKKS